MKRICVFCGSSPGAGEEYAAAARLLGKTIVERGYGLVYGGARLGLMGQVAQAALEADGEVIGVIPHRLLELEIANTLLVDLRVVESMHERKSLMLDLSDGFIALPGGLGTLEEFFEMLTGGQLELHDKPCGLLNVAGYYDTLLAFLDYAQAQQFIYDAHRKMVLVEDSPDKLLDRFEAYSPPCASKADWAKLLSSLDE